MNDTNPTDSSEPARRGLRRALGLVGVLAVLWAVGAATGLHEHLSADNIRMWAGQSGPFGLVLFVAAFAFGQVAQVSGHAFIAAAVLVWGWWVGAIVSIVGATAGAILSFWFARRVGGDIRHVERPMLQRVLSSLDAAPLRTVVVARLVLMTTPPLAPALALSGLRHRDHAIGSLIGLIPSVFVSAYVWAFGLEWFGLIS